ncbi:MAG: 2-oxoacid:acceptor oxidoreductase family protein [Archaeoglobaceae archaeon]|nr:2-oxoacid:acceptor oxidoreductase family protein [Archaeoglobaceae archaeon]
MEIRIHGRGGQGVVTASKIIAEAAHFEGYYSQSIPYFGAERRGAPVQAFSRLSDKPIFRVSQIYHPDIVMVFDLSLIKIPEVLSGLKSNSFAILNSKNPLSVAKNVVYVNATDIAMNNNLIASGLPIPNIPMLGALLKTNIPISYEAMLNAIEQYFGEKEETFKAFEEGFKKSKLARLKFKKRKIKRDIDIRCELPVSYPCEGVAGRTDLWRFVKPVIDANKCNKCMNCWLHCPEGVIMESEDAVVINYDYCKGCMICKEVCPRDAITAVGGEVQCIKF